MRILNIETLEAYLSYVMYNYVIYFHSMSSHVINLCSYGSVESKALY